MKQNLIAFILGLFFALGLGISQMSNPQKVLGFMDILGNWDPSLLVVFVAASGTYYIFYNMVFDKDFIGPFHANLSPKEILEPRVFIGSTLFGIGWGLSGLCPGPAVTGLGSGKTYFMLFVPAMLVGMFLVKRFVK